MSAGTVTAIPWTRGLALACPACHWSGPPTAFAGACPRCGGPLETRYPDGVAWRVALQREDLTDLGQSPTPLLDGGPGVGQDLLKLELRNPTGSHKDRFHAISAALARLAGAPGVVTTSTGNHGVSCAAHAAAEGLPSIVLATGAVPPALALQIAAHGGLLAQVGAAEVTGLVRALVESGWLPATSSDPELCGSATPYGIDGYRALAGELVDQLGALPDAVSVPCASGDTLVGIVRGLVDEAEWRGAAVPMVLACQPARAAALEASLDAGRQVVLDDPQSLARSTADPTVGRLAIAAVGRFGAAVVVADEQIAAATRLLARRGIYAEPASALALAGARLARERGLVAPDATVVSVVTAQGRGWSEREPGLFAAVETVRDPERVLERAAAIAQAGRA